jgi:hypothetical protein
MANEAVAIATRRLGTDSRKQDASYAGHSRDLNHVFGFVLVSRVE